MPTTETALGAQLERLIAERGTTARKIAEKAGLSTDAVRNLIKGRATSPRATTLQALADALGVPGTALMMGFATAEAVPAPVERPDGWVDVPQVAPFETDAPSLLDVPAEGYWRMPEAALVARHVQAADAVIVRFAANETPLHRAGDYYLVTTAPGILPPRRGGWAIVRDPGYGHALVEYRRTGEGLERRFTTHDADGKEVGGNKMAVTGMIVGAILG